MTPPAPPLPVPRNLPFHDSAGGSHTSILMCDSAVGASVAAMRQNAGVCIAAADALAFGARNDPAATDVAAVIVVSCSLSPLSASQDPAGVCASSGIVASVAATATPVAHPFRAAMGRTAEALRHL